MLFVKIIGILFLCSLAAADVITFKPFIKSRYSLRARRAKSTTKAPLIKTNDDTVLNSTDVVAEAQSSSTPGPTQLFDTTKALTEKQQGSYDQTTAFNVIPSTTPAVTVTITPVTTTPANLITASGDKYTTTSSATEVVNLENVVTEKIVVADKTTTKKIETTTQTEWLYDYYASDDESPRRETSA